MQPVGQWAHNSDIQTHPNLAQIAAAATRAQHRIWCQPLWQQEKCSSQIPHPIRQATRYADFNTSCNKYICTKMQLLAVQKQQQCSGMCMYVHYHSSIHSLINLNIMLMMKFKESLPYSMHNQHWPHILPFL